MNEHAQAAIRHEDVQRAVGAFLAGGGLVRVLPPEVVPVKQEARPRRGPATEIAEDVGDWPARYG